MLVTNTSRRDRLQDALAPLVVFLHRADLAVDRLAAPERCQVGTSISASSETVRSRTPPMCGMRPSTSSWWSASYASPHYPPLSGLFGMVRRRLENFILGAVSFDDGDSFPSLWTLAL